MATAVDHTDKTGAFKRKDSKHRHIISKENSEYLPEAGRYHLHIALACPWACGVLCVLYMKGLDKVISHSTVHPTWGKTRPDDDSDAHCGWIYRKPDDKPMSNTLGYGSFPSDELCIPDTVTNAKSVREIYNLCRDEVGPFTTPLLYDTKTKTIVNNESTEIMKMLNSAFNDFSESPTLDLYPADLQDELQELNDETVYPKVNNGVYRCGFAKSQGAYNEAVDQLFDSLELLEEKLSKQRFLGGDKFTWLDLRLFMTLVRFDPVYVTYFKTNKKRIVDYPNLLGFVRDIYSKPDVKRVISFDHIKVHYFTSHPVLNNYAIVPAYSGPDLNVPSGRDAMMGASQEK
jgi:putative glutathione S-transferase